MADYVAPSGPLDAMTAYQHFEHVRRGWDWPIWLHRNGRMNQLLQWCLDRARGASVERGEDAAQLEESLYQGYLLADTIYEALNPEGATLLREGVPDKSAELGKPYSRWRNVTQTVWNHDPPGQYFDQWAAAFDRKELVHWPVRCNPEAVINVLDDYLKKPEAAHPWIEWILFDALMRAAIINVAENAHLIAIDIASPARHRKRTALSSIVWGAFDQKRAASALAAAVPLQRAADAMMRPYRQFSGEGWTVSPTRVRELMVDAEKVGGAWHPACYVLIDRAISKDPAVWNLQAP